MKIAVRDRQSLVDIALQACGSVEAVFAIAERNGLAITDDLVVGQTLTYETADIISSYVYRKGLQEFNYGYSTAVSMFNSVINFALLMLSNYISRKYSETSLF